MITLLYDNSFYGLLTAIFTVYEQKIANPFFCAENRYAADLISQPQTIITNSVKAERIAKAVADKISPAAFDLIFTAFLSEIPQSENYIYLYIKNGLVLGKKQAFDINRPEVNFLSNCSKAVSREKHLHLGIIRFRQLKDDSYYSAIEPQFNILPLIGNHFRLRFGNQNWIIQDLKRSTALICLQKRLSLSEVIQTDSQLNNYDSPDADIFDGMEADYQKLWQEYFKNIVIEERKNLKLQMHFIPKKYWRHLIEKQ